MVVYQFETHRRLSKRELHDDDDGNKRNWARLLILGSPLLAVVLGGTYLLS